MRERAKTFIILGQKVGLQDPTKAHRGIIAKLAIKKIEDLTVNKTPEWLKAWKSKEVTNYEFRRLA